MKLHAQNQVYTATKINESTTNILKLLFFTINLHFVKSNQISINRKLNLPLTGSIYFVLLCLKRNDPQPFKKAAAKTFFSSVHITGKTCFNECFLFYVITGRYYFL